MMKRYFLVLAVLSGSLLAAAFALGLLFLFERSQGAAAPSMSQPLGGGAFAWHMAVAILAALTCLFTHCLAFTYLLGTGKWVKEVALAYQLPENGWPAQTKRFKIDVNRWMLAAMAATILATVTGAGAQTEPASAWPTFHALFAVLVLFGNLFAFWKEHDVIVRNERVLNEVKAEADRLRAASGAAD